MWLQRGLTAAPSVRGHALSYPLRLALAPGPSPLPFLTLRFASTQKSYFKSKSKPLLAQTRSKPTASKRGSSPTSTFPPRRKPLASASSVALRPHKEPQTQPKESNNFSSKKSLPKAASATKKEAPLATSFAELGLGSELIEGLKAMPNPIVTPTPIQSMVLPHIRVGDKNVVFADQTGTGKSLAYLLPVLQGLKRDELRFPNYNTEPNRPRAIILVPNRELGEQVFEIAKHLSHFIKLKVRFFTAGFYLRKTDIETLEKGMDVLICTPGRLNFLLNEKKLLYLKHVRYIVVDEADTMFEADFKAELDSIFEPIRKRLGFYAEQKRLVDPNKEIKAPPLEERDSLKEAPKNYDELFHQAQFIFVCATLTKQLEKTLATEFGPLRTLKSERLHRSLASVKFDFIETENDRHQTLVDTIESTLKASASGVIVFCNSLPSARSTAHVLTNHDIRCANLHGAVPPARRKEDYEAFKSGKARVLVCTDLTARGLDIPNLGHVILFDFPFNTVDFIHRVGRTGRNGSAGRVTAFVTHRDLPLVNYIKNAIASGEPLEHLVRTADQKYPLTSIKPRRPKKEMEE